MGGTRQGEVSITETPLMVCCLVNGSAFQVGSMSTDDDGQV